MFSWGDSRHSSTAVVLWHTEASPNLTPMYRLSAEERDASLSTRRVTGTLVMAGGEVSEFSFSSVFASEN